MNSASFKIVDNGHLMSLNELLKTASRAENAVLKAGANVMKKHVKKALVATKLDIYSTGKYNDRLIDALRVTKPRNGEIKVHILGTRKSGSGTFRLRFFESDKTRYNKSFNGHPLNKRRKVGSLSKYNGFFAKGVNSSQSEMQTKMDMTLEKYMNRIWNG